MSGHRIQWVDYAKGLAILLVIVGHTTTNAIIKGAIFSFHMPLFFIMSGVTYRTSGNWCELRKKTQKSFLKLVVLAFVIYLVRYIIYHVIIKHESFEITNSLLAMVFASGVQIELPSRTVMAMGMTWFLIALFMSRTIYDIMSLTLSERLLPVFAILGTVAGVFISRLFWLPLDIDIAMAVLVFIWVGKKIESIINKSQKHLVLYAVLFFVVWVCSFSLIFYISRDYIELASRRYPLFPLCYFVAVMGTLMLICFSFLAARVKWIDKFMSWAGKNSIIIFCVHYFDILYKPLWDLHCKNHLIAISGSTMLRLSEAIVISVVVIMLINLKGSKKQRE